MFWKSGWHVCNNCGLDQPFFFCSAFITLHVKRLVYRNSAKTALNFCFPTAIWSFFQFKKKEIQRVNGLRTPRRVPFAYLSFPLEF